MDGKKLQHESFGTVSVGRVSSSGHFLFGSDARHHHFVHVQIQRAEVNRDLSRDWIRGRERLLDFYLTEAQWAHFVSSFGDGTGTPITLGSVAGKSMDKCPVPEYARDQFSDEIKERVNDAVGSLKETADKLRETLKPGNKPLGKKELSEVLSSVERAIRQVTSNLPYIEKCFNESIDKKMTDAKIEFEAIVSRRLQEMGLESLKKSLPEVQPPALPE